MAIRASGLRSGGGGDHVSGNGNFAEQPPLFHFRFELVQRIIHGVYLLKLIGNDLSYFPHGMGDFLTINPLPLKNLGNCGGFRLNILKGSAVALQIAFISGQVSINLGFGIISGLFPPVLHGFLTI